MGATDSKLTTSRLVDDPVALDASYRMGTSDRRLIDNQILGIQKYLVSSVIGGVQGTYAKISNASVTLAAGDVVVTAATGAADLTVTKATGPALSSSPTVFGVSVGVGIPGSFALFATAGALPPSITGLSAGSPGAVRLNNGSLQYTASPGSSDIIVGTQDSSGWFTFKQPVGSGDYKIALTSDFTNSTAVSAPSTLAFPILAGETWEFEYLGSAQCSSTGGLKYTVTGPAAPTLFNVFLESSSSAIITPVKQKLTINTVQTTACHTVATTPGQDFIGGTITASVDGTVAIQIQNVTGVQVATILAGGYLKATKVTLV